MIRRNRGRNAKVEAKKDVVKSKAISVKKVVGLTAVIVAAFVMLSPSKAVGEAIEVLPLVKPATEQTIDNDPRAHYQIAVKYRKKAHYWAHKRGAGHRYHRFSRPYSNSILYEKLRQKRWTPIANREKRLYKTYILRQKRLDRANKSFDLALKLASEHYGVSYSWLHACAYSEGHIEGRRRPKGPVDPFIMNKHGSGAGGWMQFMESTFYGNIEGAKPLPRKYRKWGSKLGQAYVAAYMFKHGQSKQWTGPGCN